MAKIHLEPYRAQTQDLCTEIENVVRAWMKRNQDLPMLYRAPIMLNALGASCAAVIVQAPERFDETHMNFLVRTVCEQIVAILDQAAQAAGREN